MFILENDVEIKMNSPYLGRKPQDVDKEVKLRRKRSLEERMKG